MTFSFCASSFILTAENGRVGKGRYVVSGGSGSAARMPMLVAKLATPMDAAMAMAAWCAILFMALLRKLLCRIGQPHTARHIPKSFGSGQPKDSTRHGRGGQGGGGACLLRHTRGRLSR